jgi:malate synthase
MMAWTEDVQGFQRAIDVKSSDACRQDLPKGAPRHDPTPAAAAITRAGFLDQIDSYVRHLAAMLGGSDAAHADDELSPAERARVQLWHWLHDGGALLEDGTPVDFALFDAAIQRVGERLPRRGLPGQENVLQASWLLAELTHARTLTEPALVPVLVRTL